MNIALWIAAGLLAAIALIAGMSKLVMPRERLAAQPGGEWVGDNSPAVVKTIAALEVLAAAGFLLPRATGIAPVLVPITAVCWIALMAGAMVTHNRRGQTTMVALNLLYLALAVFVAVGRF